MPDNHETRPLDDSSQKSNADPLRIIGWVIGGKYKINSHLGGGGFGEVYEGYNENLPEQRVVIKFFKRVQAREKFAKEAKILCMLDHPNINRVIDFLPEEGAVVVAFIDGRDGGVILKDSGALAEDLFLKVARSMTSAIAYAHEKKIAHRDIKPGNIIIDRQDNVYLIDFGIAKEMGTDATKTAYTALTPMFAAPERQTGTKNYNPFISDIYETGITLFNFATNSLPYRNPTNPNFGEWGGIAARRLSPELTRILKKATHPKPSERYQTMSDMARDFQALTKAYGQGRKKSPILIVTAVLAVAVIAAAFLGRGYISEFFSPERAAVVEPATPETTDSVPSPTPEQPPVIKESTQPATAPQNKPTDTSTQKTTPPREEKPAVTETPKPASSKQSETKPATQPEEKPTPPPPPPKSQLLVMVMPDDIQTLTVDGRQRSINRRFELDPGRHEFVVAHPDYPLLRKSMNVVAGETTITFKLADEMPRLDSLDMQVALIPPSDNHILEITWNGKKQSFTNFPLLGYKQAVGEWNIGLNIRGIGDAAGQSARVDSCVVFPRDAVRRFAVRGAAGTLKLTASTVTGETAPLLIYWTNE